MKEYLCGFFFFFVNVCVLFVPLNMLHVQAFPYATRLISPRVCARLGYAHARVFIYCADARVCPSARG